QLEGVQHAAEAGLGVGDDGREPVDLVLAFGVVDLVGAGERVVDAPHDGGDAGDRVERLVGIHGEAVVGVGGDLPARQVDRGNAGLDLLHRLVAGERAERIHERPLVHEAPELLGAAAGEGVLDLHAAAQPVDVFGGVAATHALPAGVLGP